MKDDKLLINYGGGVAGRGVRPSACRKETITKVIAD